MTSHIRLTLAVVGAVALASATPAVRAHRTTLNDTGMTQCIDHQGNWSTECARSRQDAAYGRDVDNADPNDGVAGFSYRKVCRSGDMAGEGNCPIDPVLGAGPDDWGCVYDNVTQLTWETKTNDGGMHSYLHQFSNRGKRARDDSSDAAWLVDATNTEALCGATNWRLPDILELESIVDYGGGAPAKAGLYLDVAFFPFDKPGETWTRMERVNEPKQAWYVRIQGGNIGSKQRFDSSGNARLVHRVAHTSSSRHMQSADDRFIPSVDGTEVTDTMTGLIWRRCSEGMVWNNASQTCDGTDARFDRKEALDYIKAHREGGWRIPNVKELLSIADQSTRFPAIDQVAFPNTPLVQYVLSSTYADAFGDLHLKIVDFSYGVVREEDTVRGNSWSLRLVRRGRE
jgi:hypothetical protein